MVQLFYGLMNQTAIVRMTLASAFVSPGIFGCFRFSPPCKNERFVTMPDRAGRE